MEKSVAEYPGPLPAEHANELEEHRLRHTYAFLGVETYKQTRR